MKRVFVDMDGVLVDFDAKVKETGLPPDELKKHPGAYLSMKPVPGALEAVRKLIEMDYEVWIATKPPTGVAAAYQEKAQWIFDHLPELAHRIIMTHDKGLLGDTGDFLIDDRIHKANCLEFRGTLIEFCTRFDWPTILSSIRAVTPQKVYANV